MTATSSLLQCRKTCGGLTVMKHGSRWEMIKLYTEKSARNAFAFCCCSVADNIWLSFQSDEFSASSRPYLNSVSVQSGSLMGQRDVMCKMCNHLTVVQN